MADTTDWTPRNKANPFFAKENHKRLAKNQKTKPLVDYALPPEEEEE